MLVGQERTEFWPVPQCDARGVLQLSDIDLDFPMAERAAIYRKRALDTLLLAEASKDERVREAYFKLAQSWHSLATHIEEDLGLRPSPQPLMNFQTSRAQH